MVVTIEDGYFIDDEGNVYPLASMRREYLVPDHYEERLGHDGPTIPL